MSIEFQNETQDSSAPASRAEEARNPYAQRDECGGGSDCLQHANAEFEEILRVLAEC